MKTDNYYLFIKKTGQKNTSVLNVSFPFFPRETLRTFYLSKKLNRSFYDHTLISTSTPLGSSNFIKASIVLEEEL